MIVRTVADSDGRGLEHARFVYRGFDPDRERHVRARGFRPKAILPYSISDPRFVTLCMQSTDGHVLGLKEWGKSFAVTPETSLYYATHGGSRRGALAVIQLPRWREVIRVGSRLPALFIGDDGSEWVDPRALPFGRGEAGHDLEVENRSGLDREVLLVRPPAVPTQVLLVGPQHCPRQFEPWSVSGQTIPGLRFETGRFVVA